MNADNQGKESLYEEIFSGFFTMIADAASAAWVNPGHLRLFVQIIDQYFGTLSINLCFRDAVLGVYMTKVAEDFLQEYSGYAGGIRE